MRRSLIGGNTGWCAAAPNPEGERKGRGSSKSCRLFAHAFATRNKKIGRKTMTSCGHPGKNFQVNYGASPGACRPIDTPPVEQTEIDVCLNR